MSCSNCNRMLTGESKFCVGCGTLIQLEVEDIKFYRSMTKKSIAITVFMSIIVLLNTLFFIMGDRSIFMIIILMTVGIYYISRVAYLVSVLQKKVLLIVDKDGVTDHITHISFGFIPWNDIKEIRKDLNNDKLSIEILLVDEDKYINKLSDMKRERTKKRREKGLSSFVIVSTVETESSGLNFEKTLWQMQILFEKYKNDQGE